MSDALTYELDGKVARLRLDDGKANAMTPDLLVALDEALTRAEAEANAVLIIGREGKFSAGFDLAVMTSGTEPMRSLVGQGARWMMRLYGSPLPTIAACTGHALAGGALTLLSCDVRIGVDGPFKIGLNEVAIGMGLPIFAVELARDRLSRRHFQQATSLGRVYSPAQAVDAGFLDELADDPVEAATATASALAELSAGAVAQTKANARRDVIAHILDTLDGDMTAISGPAS